MRTVSRIDRWFDESAEALIGLPLAEAIQDVMIAGLHVEVSRPGVRRVRDTQQDGVALVANRQGVVLDVIRLEERPVRADPRLARRRGPDTSAQASA